MSSKGEMESRPVFLVGAERSGTTLLRLILSHHPQLSWCNEFEYVVDQVPDDSGWPDLEEYYQWLGMHRIFQATGFEIDRSLDYPSLVNSFLVQRRQRDGKPIVGATVHRHLDRLLRIWPDARFIHLLRDGRDVAKSVIQMGWAGSGWHGTERWLHAEHKWDHLCEVVPEDRRAEVTFENMIGDLEQTMKGLCEFIGLPYSDAMLDYHKDTTYGPPDIKIVRQWERKLSSFQIRLAEARAGEMLVRRGYALSGLPPIKVGPFLRVWLRVQNRWHGIRSRQKRLGFSLWAASVVAERIGTASWRRRVHQRVNEQVRATLK